MGQWKMAHCCSSCDATNPIATPRGPGLPPLALCPCASPGPCPRALAQDPPPLLTGRVRHQLCGAQTRWPSGQVFVSMQPVFWVCQGEVAWLTDATRTNGSLVVFVSVICQHLRAFTWLRLRLQLRLRLRLHCACGCGRGCGRAARPRGPRRGRCGPWRRSRSRATRGCCASSG